MVTPIRVVIADDDVLLREGLASLLERAGWSRHRPSWCCRRMRSILTKLDLSEASDDHRRVLAVITFLEDR